MDIVPIEPEQSNLTIQLREMYGWQRCLRLQKVIFDSFMAVGDAPPSDSGLVEMIQVWASILEPVPDERLNEYFIRAARKKGGYRVNAQDIVMEWNKQTANRRTDMLLPEADKGKWY